uniref:Uncharacterized protein n=1 Tax=Cuerna arida TaxID=1464854 RepID=A0A1B6G3D7_9HEMI
MTQSPRDTIIHLIAGGVAGTMGAIVTCPLEVVKTRLQSSSSGFHVHKVCVPKIASPEGNNHGTCKTIVSQRRRINTVTSRHATQFLAISHYDGGVPPNKSMGLIQYIRHIVQHEGPRALFKGLGPNLVGVPPNKSMGLIQYIRHIVQHEGPRALFKGLGPNLVGVAPSRAIYFCAYSQAKSFLNSVLTPDTAIVHILSASCAGFVACSATNPIWFVKTRLQLDFTKSGQRLTAAQCIRRIYRQSEQSWQPWPDNRGLRPR